MSATTPATIGIDLASQPKGTAACVIEWRDDGGRVALLAESLTNSAIGDLVRSRPVAKVGIDAPFGWPIAYVAAIAGYSASGRWPEVGEKELEFRATDRYVRAIIGRWPLSVSTNYIAYIAFRCAALLTEIAEPAEPIDRTGSGLAVEVYPAAALVQWGVASRGYKRRSGTTDAARGLRQETLAGLIREIREAGATWLDMSDSDVARLEESDDLFDALVAALIARATDIGRCLPIPLEHAGAAKVEGWIHLPTAEPFASFRPV